MRSHLVEKKLRSLNLPPRILEVCVMRFGRRMWQDDIADELRVSQQFVSWCLANARRRYPQLPRLLTHGRRRRVKGERHDPGHRPAPSLN
jgi:predicted DNA-binding protein (UPF0251 family)